MFKTIDVSERKGNGFNDLTGKRFERLRVIGLSAKKSGRKSYWVCKCDCGNKKLVRSDSLKDDSIKSCGCLKKEQDEINLTKHHRHMEAGTPLYTRWQGIKARCYYKDSHCYEFYGGRGIRVCEEWKNSYEAFAEWARNNGYSKELTIERIDVNGDYCPENCTWVTQQEQNNNRRSNVWIEWRGMRKNIQQWSECLNFDYGTLHSRYYRNGLRPPELFKPLEH